jgi:UDP-3-O-[3-hydroxymyristoyl] glucosamine N-acyltransferase
MKNFLLSVDKIIYQLNLSYKLDITVFGNKKIMLSTFSDFSENRFNSIKFYENNEKNKYKLKKENNNLIITNKKIKIDLTKNCLIIFENPRYLFNLLIELLLNMSNYEKYLTSEDLDNFDFFVKNKIKFAKNVIINQNTVVKSNTFIDHGTVIGKAGLAVSYYKKKKYNFFHIGNVKIGKNNYIGSNCVIMRGMLKNTTIGNNCSIGNLVNIGHNVKIGNNVSISSGVMIAGGARIDDNSIISMGSKINEKIKIGKNCFVGIGSVVTKSFKSNTKIFGNPAYKYGNR